MRSVNARWNRSWLVGFFVGASLSAAPSLKTVSESSPKAVVETSKAVGFVRYVQGGAYNSQSGFFIKPNLFVTAQDPANTTELSCPQTSIYLNLGDGKKSSLEGAHIFECAKIVYTNARMGIAVIQTIENSNYVLPVATAVELSDGYLSALGYSFEAMPYHSDKCRTNSKQCRLCDKDLVDLAYWRELRCLSRSGMVGSPVLKEIQGKLFVVGMLGIYLAKSDKATPENNSELVSMVELTALPKLLSDAGVSN